MTTLDLVLCSGRESLPLTERVGLLRADSAWLQGMDPSGPSRRGQGDFIHDLVQLYALINDTVFFFEKSAKHDDDRTRIEGSVHLAFISRLECRVLAWRRGGHQEERRIARLQREACA